MTLHKAFSVFLSIALLVMLLGGCGNPKEDPSVEGSSFENITETPAPTATPEPTPTPSPTPTPTPTPSANPWTGKVVVLDPGHSAVVTGEMEPIGPGASKMKEADTSGTHGDASGLNEYELALNICQKLKASLEQEGYVVFMTREDHNTAVSCSQRAKIATEKGADAFLRIHADGSTDPSRNGSQTICITPGNPYHPELYAESRSLSDNILQSYCYETGIRNNGVWETDTMTGNNWATMPTTLLEMGFMTNANEDLRMASEEFQYRMVRGIVQGLNNYFAGRDTGYYPVA